MIRRSFEAVLHVLLSVGLLVFTGIFAASPLLLLKQKQGRVAYYFVCLLAVIVLPFLSWGVAISFFTIAISVAAYSESRDLGLGEVKSLFVSILASTAVACISLVIWMKTQSTHPIEYFQSQIHEAVAQVKLVQPAILLDEELLLLQIPSATLIVLMLNLWLAMLAERWRFPLKKHAKLSEFHLPDPMIWILVAVFALALMDIQSVIAKILWLNLLNVTILLYFFQGLAVITSYFQSAKITVAWQIFWYIVLVLQMFIIVSLLGVADYWLDFRKRISKNSAEIT